MADGTISIEVEPKPKNKGGRPKIARGAATTADTGDVKWTIRGVPRPARALAAKAATARGMTLGDFVAEAITVHARSAWGEDAAAPIEDTAAQVPAVRLPQELVDTLASIQGRLDRIEADRKKPKLFGLFRQTAKP